MNIVEISDFKGAHVAALRHTGSYMGIGSAFERLWGWIMTLETDPSQNSSFGVYGIYHDDPSSVAEKDLRSDAAVCVPEDTELPEEFRWLDIRAGRYGVYEYKGPYAGLADVYQWLYGVWLPESGEELADQPCFEQYMNSPVDTPPTELLTKIMVPLKD